MKRFFDALLALLLIGTAALPMICIAVTVRLTSADSILFWSKRLGRNNRVFKMPKFRTMRADAPDLPSDELATPERWLTPVGNFLRRTSLDELPQLWSVVKGDMSLVGPRPALHNQYELIALRKVLGLDSLRPGLTGWAQVNGRNALTLKQKAALDVYYLKHQSSWFDLKILAITAWKVLRREGTEVPRYLMVHPESSREAA